MKLAILSVKKKYIPREGNRILIVFQEYNIFFICVIDDWKYILETDNKLVLRKKKKFSLLEINVMLTFL